MSHWIKGVSIIDSESRNEVLDLSSSAWSLVSHEVKDYGIDLLVAQYSDQNRRVTIAANLYKGTAKLSKPSKLKMLYSLFGSRHVQLNNLQSELKKFI